MANGDLVHGLLTRGTAAWNKWRRENREIAVDLSDADLRKADLSLADLRDADLRQACLWKADLRDADLRQACLWKADLRGADLSGADLSGADLRGADLRGADLSGADLIQARLRGAHLIRADLSLADLRDADLHDAILDGALHSEVTYWPSGYDARGHGAIRAYSSENASKADFTITFDGRLSPEQIVATLKALSDYYRACGGAGLAIDPEIQKLRVENPVYV